MGVRITGVYLGQFTLCCRRLKVTAGKKVRDSF